MKKDPELQIHYFNEYNERKTLQGRDLEEQIDQLVQVLTHVLQKMEHLTDTYELKEFTAQVGLKLGAWILKADGGISITWTKNERVVS